MPVKRRVSKGRDIDDLKLVELVEGPGRCLLAGCGYYLWPADEWRIRGHKWGGVASPDGEDGFFWEVSEAGQAIILEAMRADWNRVGAGIMAQAADPQDVWAFAQFGPPESWAGNGGSNSNDR